MLMLMSLRSVAFAELETYMGKAAKLYRNPCRTRYKGTPKGLMKGTLNPKPKPGETAKLY